MAPIQFCHPSYLKRVHFCTLVSASQLRVMKHHPPTRFYSPPQLNISKNVIFIPKLPIFRDFRRFFARKNVKYEPIWKWFSLLDSFQQALQHCGSQFSRHELRCMKIIIETFLRENRFPCVNSVDFEAKSIWISRDVLARRTEQFDTTHDFLGRKLAKLENSIFRSARDRFSKKLLF